VAIGKQNTRGAEQHGLNGRIFFNVIADGWHDGRGEAIVVERDLVLVFAFVTLDKTDRNFGEQLGVACNAIPALAHIDIGGGLAKGVAKHGQATKAIARHGSV